MNRRPNTYTCRNHVEIYRSEQELLKLIERLISEASSTIHFHMYILKEDTSGRKILTALKEAALRGVKVYMLIDAFGSVSLAKDTIVDLKKHGVYFEWYNAFRWSRCFQAIHRLHQKVIIFDQKIAILGGFNISNDYLAPLEENPWLDFAVLVTGEVVREITLICNRLLQSISEKNLNLPLLVPSRLEGSMRAKVIYNNFLQGKFQVSQSYKHAIRHAKKEIFLVQSYFFPNHHFLRLLKHAAQRGVKIKLLLPKKSDVPLFKYACNYLYRYLLRYKIEIFEWKPSVLHAKLAVIDDIWCTVGSYNINYTSHVANVEMNLLVWNSDFAKTTKNLLSQAMLEQTNYITKDLIAAKTSLFEKVRDYCAYKIVNLCMFFTKILA
ncbi:MAG: hypothetical protein K0S74_296 [Chlamydiales bacterium]|jgi:cardiolipin synthase|nr:hypothetical protein [Chlamydiales bacterium]